MEIQTQNKANLEKKGEKISKYQGDLQSLSDRLRDEEALKKKLSDKNK